MMVAPSFSTVLSRVLRVLPAGGVYAASKATIRSFVRTWTTDLKDRRIRSTLLARVRSIRRWRLGKLQT